MKAIKEMFGRMDFRGMRKRAIASALALLMIFSMVPTVWLAANAADNDYTCGMEEHAHTAECYAAEASCGVEESEEHTHSAECYALVCGKTEHAHSEACEAPAEKSGENSGSDLSAIDENSESDIALIDEDQPEGTTLSVSGVWDVGGTPIAFPAAGAEIEWTDLAFPKEYEVSVAASFPSGTEKYIKVTLAPGLVWVNNGADDPNIQNYIDGVDPLAGSSSFAGTTFQDGYYVYHMKDTTSEAGTVFTVKLNTEMDYAEIQNAITVEASYIPEGETEAQTAQVALSSLACGQLTAGYTGRSLVQYQQNTASAKQGETASGFLANVYNLSHQQWFSRCVEEVTFTVEVTAPSEDAPQLDVSRCIAQASSVQSGSNSAELFGEPVSNGAVTTYTFKKENFRSSYYGINVEWLVPEDAPVGSEYTAVCTGISFKLLGNDNEYSVNPTTNYLKINVLDAQAINTDIRSSSGNITFYAGANGNEIRRFGRACFYNAGTDPSKPMVVEYTFPDELDVCAVQLYEPHLSGAAFTKFEYMLQGGEWQEKTLSIPAKAGAQVTKADLGIADDQYLKGLKVYYDFETADENIGLNPGSDNKNAQCTSVLGKNKNNKTSESVTTNVKIKNIDGTSFMSAGAEVTKVETSFTTSFRAGNYSTIRVPTSDEPVYTAGQTIDFNIPLRALAVAGDISYLNATYYPLIYIRDETGLGISNVALKNTKGVDLFAKHGLKAEFSHTEADGTKVYKIDTSPLANLTEAQGKYDAAIGYINPLQGYPYSTVGLNLTYSVDVPGSYNDGGITHYLSNAIFFASAADGEFTYASQAVRDTYGVDNGAGKSVYYDADRRENRGTYKILGREDVTVSFAAKRAVAEDYETYSSSNPIQVEAGAAYNVKTTIKNNSGQASLTGAENATTVYIPIPKQGENWGLGNRGIDENGDEINSFAFSMNLTGNITNPDPTKFTISYGTVPASFAANAKADAVVQSLDAVTNWSSTYSADTNCVRIVAQGLDADTGYDFVMNLTVDNSAENQQFDEYSAIYHQTYVANDIRYTGDFTGDKVGFKVVWGSINGRVFKDNNGDGIYNAGDEVGFLATVDLIDGSTRHHLLTDADGLYRKTQLNAVTYGVDVTGIPSGLVLPEDFEDTITIPQVIDGRTTYDITLDIPLLPTHTISYEFTTDSETPEDVTAPVGESVLAGVEYTVETIANVIGYTFDGWYKDAYGSGDKISGNQTATSSVTYIGKWTINKYTIDFDSNGGSEVADITADYGTAVTAPADPTREGYTFKGWDKNIPATIPAEDITITAQWEINEYTIDFDSNGGSEVADITADYGTAVTAPADPTKTGYTFKGWDKEIPATIPAEDITITAQWDINEYTITFDTKGGTEIAPITADYGTAVTAPADPTKTGYTFKGWDVEIPDTMPAEDITITAKWEVIQYTIDFDSNGGSEVADITADYGTAVTAPADPTKTGYTFKGWDKDIPATIPSENITITAQWEINEYTIDFDSNGGSEVADITADYGTAVTAPADPTREGYTFKGWDVEIPDTMPAEDITITAKWEINNYDVTYAWNDAPDAAVLPEADTVPYKTEYSAKAPNACTGYTFDGWYTDESCTTAYTDGTAITEDTTLYGRWTRNTVDITGSVTWVENGEGFTRPETVTVNILQNGTEVSSTDVIVDTADSQSFTFIGLPEYSEDGTVKYEYTVEQNAAPANYVETVSGFEIVNTYNVNTYKITVLWDHTGAPTAEKVTEATVILNRDGSGYKTATLTESNPTGTTTIPRLEADGHTFSIVQNAIAGYETTYGEPEGVDTDNDGTVDAVAYTITNTYIMPKITVSGEIFWEAVPDGEDVPDITVNLIKDGEVIDTAEVSAGNISYQFTDLDRYSEDGTAIEYTVEVEEIASYNSDYSEAETDENGNIAVNITNTGDFAYGTLTLINTIIGGDDEFTFIVTVGKNVGMRRALVQYPYKGTYSGFITAGEPMEITLRSGEYITISDMLVGVGYSIEQKAHPDYYTTPASLTAEGVISADETVEPFVNSKIPTGTLSIATKVTGSAADENTIFEYKVTLDSDESFEYVIGETKGTLKSGDVLRLKHGEIAVISGIKEETAYNVEQVADQGYKMTSTGASGKVTAQGITASFLNTKNSSVAGGSDVAPDTGDYGKGSLIAVYVMQMAMLMMLFCAWRMKRRSEED